MCWTRGTKSDILHDHLFQPKMTGPACCRSRTPTPFLSTFYLNWLESFVWRSFIPCIEIVTSNWSKKSKEPRSGQPEVYGGIRHRRRSWGAVVIPLITEPSIDTTHSVEFLWKFTSNHKRYQLIYVINNWFSSKLNHRQSNLLVFDGSLPLRLLWNLSSDGNWNLWHSHKLLNTGGEDKARNIINIRIN